MTLILKNNMDVIFANVQVLLSFILSFEALISVCGKQSGDSCSHLKMRKLRSQEVIGLPQDHAAG